MRGYPEHLHEIINEDLQESIYDETLEGEIIRDSQYSLENIKKALDVLDNVKVFWSPSQIQEIELAINVLRKQISRKVIETPAYQSYYSAGDESEILCPNCEEELDIENQIKCCCECGQKLDWGDIVW